MSDTLIEFCASFLIYFIFLGLLVLWVIDGKIKKEQVLHALYACSYALLLSVIIKYLFPTIRPYMLNGGKTDVFFTPLDASFPSEHTVLAFAVSVTVFLHDRRVGWWFLLASLLVGYGRVLANIHYPLDILGGALIGTLVAVIVDKTHFLQIFSSGRKSKGR